MEEPTEEVIQISQMSIQASGQIYPVEVYVWLPPTSLNPCAFWEDMSYGNYGHAAMLIPWYPGARVNEKYPLYVSLYNTARFVSKENDIGYFETKKGCKRHKVKLACSEQQVASLWQKILSMKNCKEYDNRDDFALKSGRYIPYCEEKEHDFHSMLFFPNENLLEPYKDAYILVGSSVKYVTHLGQYKHIKINSASKLLADIRKINPENKSKFSLSNKQFKSCITENGGYIPENEYKLIYIVPFDLFSNHENENADNCTTLIHKLLKDAKVELPKYWGSNQNRGIAKGTLQLFSGVFMGYNMGISAEICKCLSSAKTIHILAIVNLVIMMLAAVTDLFCLPHICKGSCGKLPANMLIPVPLFLLSLGFSIYTAIIHSQYYASFDTTSFILPITIGVGIVAGVGYWLGSAICDLHADSHNYITKPEGLLELLILMKEEKKKQQEANDYAIELTHMPKEITPNDKNTTKGLSFFKPALEETSSEESSLLDVDVSQPSIFDEDAGNKDKADDWLMQLVHKYNPYT